MPLAKFSATCRSPLSTSRKEAPSVVSIGDQEPSFREQATVLIWQWRVRRNAHRIRSTGYKKRDQTEARCQIIAALRTKLTIGESLPDLAQSADLVDAAVCVLAGDDFITGRAMSPENRSLAEREGWIWTAGPMLTLTLPPNPTRPLLIAVRERLR
jgi:hypothetical protein